jgi:uncharacterized protein
LHEFLAVATNLRIYKPPTPLASALNQIDAWLESPSLVLLAETEQHRSELRVVLAASQATGGQMHDARIAALCRQHGVRELWSADRDFARFPNWRGQPAHSLSFDTVIDAAGDEVAVGGAEAQSRLGFNLCF